MTHGFALLKRPVRFCAVSAACALLLGVGLAGASGWRLNLTESMPRGIYRTAYSDAGKPAIRRGQIVLFCLAPTTLAARDALRRGYIPMSGVECPGDYAPLLKRAVGLPGDRLIADEAGLFINGVRVSQPPRQRDSKGNALPVFHYRGRIPPKTLLVIGDNPRSFDGRYFGLIEQRTILGTMAPL